MCRILWRKFRKKNHPDISIQSKVKNLLLNGVVTTNLTENRQLGQSRQLGQTRFQDVCDINYDRYLNRSQQGEFISS